MRVLLSVMLLGLLMSLAGVACAEKWYMDPAKDAPKIEKGARTITVAGAYLPDDGPVQEDFQLMLGYGTFISDETELGLRWRGDEDTQDLYAYGAYHLGDPLSEAFPYVAAGVGYRFIDSASERARGADDDFLWAGGLGAKLFLKNDMSIFAEWMYTESDSVSDDVFMLGINKRIK